MNFQHHGASESLPCVAQIGLGEAGNLGDDLILVAVTNAIARSSRPWRLQYLSHGCELDWDAIECRTGLGVERTPIAVRSEAVQPVVAPFLMRGCKAAIFGGGGLIQTSHHPYRPYHWLRYLGVGYMRPPVLAVGLGLGPLSQAWSARLAAMHGVFDECWLRDDASVEVARSFGWRAARCSDFVDANLFADLGLTRYKGSKADSTLGVALRAWPGLRAADIARHVDAMAARIGLDRAKLFILESKHGLGPDVEFSSAVRALMHLPSEVSVYNSANLLDVLEEMLRCSAAISMKLHSSAIWAFGGAEVFPIVYAPKVAAHFGRSYRGLEILAQSLRPVEDLADTRPASEVVSDWLDSGMAKDPEARAFGLSRHLRCAVGSTAVQITTAMRRSLHPAG